MFCVIRLPEAAPVRLEIVADGDSWRLLDHATGLRLPSDQNIGSLVAAWAASLSYDKPTAIALLVGSEGQTLTVTRIGPLPSDFLVEDEEGVVYDALSSPADVVFSTAQMEAIEAYLSRPVRRRPSLVE
jgi:hypothetical protein